jgi:hypothetical protein
MIFYAEPDRTAAVKAAVAGAGARILEYNVETEGLVVNSG